MNVNVDKFGDWEKVINLFDGLGNKLQKAIERATRKNAMLLVHEIMKGIRNQAPGGEQFAPLAEVTIKRKGSSKALIDTGFLINSITELIMGDKAFVGLLYTAQYRDGEDVANIGAVMEFGTTITMPNGATVVIPARPFLHPVMKQYLPTVLNNFKEAITSVLSPIGS